MKISKKPCSDIRDCGVYRIVCTVTGKSYVGSSSRIRFRVRDHFKLFETGKHSKKFQNAWNKYGPYCWFVEILELCDQSDLLVRENFYIDQYDSFKNGYNSSSEATSVLGYKFSEEQKQKISEKQRMLWPESRRLEHAERLRGKKLSEETRRRMSESQSLREHTISDDNLSKIMAKIKGVPLKEEHKDKISKALTGKTLSEETRKKISERNKEAWIKRRNKKT